MEKTMNGFDFLYNVSDSEKSFFTKIGLNDDFDRFEYGEKYYLGKAKFVNGYIHVSVRAFPARFWDVYITNKVNRKHFKVSTGSGRLEDYWDDLVNVLNGDPVKQDPDMFEVTEIPEN